MAFSLVISKQWATVKANFWFFHQLALVRSRQVRKFCRIGHGDAAWDGALDGLKHIYLRMLLIGLENGFRNGDKRAPQRRWWPAVADFGKQLAAVKAGYWAYPIGIVDRRAAQLHPADQVATVALSGLFLGSII